MKIAVIPARGGSKRIPRKNSRLFCGKPILSRVIQLLRDSDFLDHIIVSTDDEEIAHLAMNSGAEAPFYRPAHLSDDFATTSDVLAHATSWILQKIGEPEAIVCVYPTSVLLDPVDLKKAYLRLMESEKDFVFSATEFTSSVYRSFKRSTAGGVSMLFPQHLATRTQDLPQVFHDAGLFYWGTPTAWVERRPIFSEFSEFFEIPPERVQDIDTPSDWIRAEKIFQSLNRTEEN